MLEKVSVSAVSGFRSGTIAKIPSQRVLSNRKSPALSGYDLKAVRKWVALEERIVHEYQHSGNECPASDVRTPSAEPESAVKPSKLSKTGKSRAPWAKLFFWVFGLAVVFFALFYFQSKFFRKTPLPFSPISAEAPQQGSRTSASDQLETIRRLKKEAQGLTQELRSIRKKEVEFQNHEKDYRNELFQLTLAYEEKLSSLRQEDLKKDDLIRGLRASLHEAEINLRKSERTSTASSFSGNALQENPVRASAGMGQAADSKSTRLQGKVVMVNSRYEFVVIDVGSREGVRAGHKVAFYKNGREFASGTVERVYPTLSGAAVFDSGVLAQIQEGEDVSVNL